MNIPILELIGLLCALNNNVTYFDSFGVEYIPKEIKKITNSSTVTTNIYRIQAYDSVMCGYFGIGSIDSDFTNLFSPNNFLKNDHIILTILEMGEATKICIQI